jgi:hypothetical protein
MASKLKQTQKARIIHKQAPFNEADYEFTDRFVPFDGNPLNAHTIAEMMECLAKGKAEIEARVITTDGKYKRFLNSKSFIEAVKKNDRNKSKLLESYDSFGYEDGNNVGSPYGQESIPMVGGPFYKQLYYYDYIRMHNLSFYAYHHDPLARMIVNTMLEFTMGRGFRVDIEDKMELAIWRSFEEANDLQGVMQQVAREISIYGEEMLWWLPNGETKIGYQDRLGQAPQRGIIPRVRTLDPSSIWDIITYPEDITRVLAYQMVSPTQYQTYTTSDGGSPVPGSKFMYQQIPSNQIDHFKVNCVSNEKRGRSDLFPVLGYLKRLRDAVNYSIIALQKQSSWCIDTAIDGSPEDIDAYVNDLNNQLAMPNPGSEFVHSSKVTRSYLAAAAGKGGGSDSFEWCISMIAAGTGIPVSYFGTHLSGGQTRASAMIATEPVAKKFQLRQSVYEKIILSMTKRLGIKSAVEITFPELIVQDRSAKLKDLALSETQGWISKSRAAEIAAKELHITDFRFDKEMEDMAAERATEPGILSPLTDPAKVDSGQEPTSGVTSADRRGVADAERAGNV